MQNIYINMLVYVYVRMNLYDFEVAEVTEVLRANTSPQLSLSTWASWTVRVGKFLTTWCLGLDLELSSAYDQILDMAMPTWKRHRQLTWQFTFGFIALVLDFF